MTALIGAYQRATNRLLPYRALHTDLVAHEEYYTFNDPTVLAFDDWTGGSNTSFGQVSTPYFDGDLSWALAALATATDDTEIYVESAVSNLNSIPTTFRVIARSNDTNRWLRIYHPNLANYGLWVDLANGVLGTIGSAVIEARIKVPDGTTQSGTGNPGSSAPGEANGFWQIDFELPPASPLTMRLQLVDGDGETNFTGSTAQDLWIAKAEALNGSVSKWTCRRTGRTFSQPITVLQPYARPMGVPKFNGRRVLKFDGGQYLVSDDAASEWDFLHSGVGCSVYAAYMPTTASDSRLMSTSDGVSEGFRIRTDIDADARTGASVWNASDTLVTSVFSSIGTTPSNTLYVAGYRCQDGHAGGDATLDVGGAQYVGNAATWGSSGAPTTTLQIGAENGANGFDGYIADIAIYDDRLTDDEHARAVEEFEALNASSLVIPGCIHNLVAGEVNASDTWIDRSPSGNNATVSATVDHIAASPSLRGSPAEVFDEAEFAFADGVATDIPDLTADHAVILTCQLTALTAGIDVIWAFQNSADVNEYEVFGVNGGQLLYERSADGAVVDSALVGTADLRPHAHSFVLASGQRSAYIDGTALFSGVGSTPGVMATDQLTLGNNRSGSLGSAIAVSELAVYDTAPTTYQRQLVERAQRRRMLGGRPLIGGYSVGQITPAPSPGSGPSPLIDNNWLTYLDADAGPVGTPSTAVGNAITDWLSLEVTGGSGPYDFAQSGSADRGVLSDTTASDSRLTVDFDGVSDFMAAVGDLGGELEGDDVDFTRFLHVITINTSGTKDMFSLCNDSGDNRDQIQQLGDDVRSLRRVTTTITNTGADVLTVGEHVIVDMRVGDTRTIWVDGVKVVNAGAESTGSITFSQVILAAVDIGSITNPAQIGVRRAGLRLGGVTDPQAATLAGANGT